MLVSGRRYATEPTIQLLDELAPAGSFNRNLLEHLVFTDWRDNERPIVDQHVLAHCAAAQSQLQSRNFSGIRYLSRFAEDIGKDTRLFSEFMILPHDSRLKRARVIDYRPSEILSDCLIAEDSQRFGDKHVPLKKPLIRQFLLQTIRCCN